MPSIKHLTEVLTFLMKCAIISGSIENIELLEVALGKYTTRFTIEQKIVIAEQNEFLELSPLDVVFLQTDPKVVLYARKWIEHYANTVPVLFEHSSQSQKINTEVCAIESIELPADTGVILHLEHRIMDLKALHEHCPAFAQGWMISLDFLLDLLEQLTTNRLILPDINGYREAIPDEILKLESEGPYTIAYFNNGGNATTCKPLSHYERVLDESKFFKLNNHTIVNSSSIIDWKQQHDTAAVLSDGSEIPIATRRLPLYIDLINKSSSTPNKDID